MTLAPARDRTGTDAGLPGRLRGTRDWRRSHSEARMTLGDIRGMAGPLIEDTDNERAPTGNDLSYPQGLVPAPLCTQESLGNGCEESTLNHTTPAKASDRPRRHAVLTAGAVGCAVAMTIALAACQHDDASGEPSSSSTTRSVPSAAASTPTRSKPASTSPPAEEADTSAASKTPTPAPARVDELKEAQAAYVKYIHAYIKAEKVNPPPGKPPKSLLAMTTGPESHWLKNAFSLAKKKESVIVSGNVHLTMGPELGYDGTEVDVIKFKACQDGRKIRLKMNGKLKHSFNWELDKVEMHQISNSSGERRWVTYGQTATKHDANKSCVIN